MVCPSRMTEQTDSQSCFMTSIKAVTSFEKCWVEKDPGRSFLFLFQLLRSPSFSLSRSSALINSFSSPQYQCDQIVDLKHSFRFWGFRRVASSKCDFHLENRQWEISTQTHTQLNLVVMMLYDPLLSWFSSFIRLLFFSFVSRCIIHLALCVLLNAGNRSFNLIRPLNWEGPRFEIAFAFVERFHSGPSVKRCNYFLSGFSF